MIPFPEIGEAGRPPKNRRNGWAWCAGLAGLFVLVWSLWRGSGTDASSAPADGASGRTGDGARAGEAGSGVGASGRSSLRRSLGFSEGLPALDGDRPHWRDRIRTNGTLEAERLGRDPAYYRRAVQHDRLKTLLQSPARDTPECDAVVAFVDRHGLPLAATVDLYNGIWAAREHEARVAGAAAAEDQAALAAVRELELSDFRRRFRRDYDVDLGPMLEELFALPLRPTVFMGVPSRAFGSGEPLLTDDGR